MPSLADLMEDYRNWRGRQEWQDKKGWEEFYGGDSEMQERAERMMGGFGTGSHGVGGLAATFAGAKARTSDLKTLDLAKQLEKSGKDAKEIWRETGWFKAPWDKRWRSEISDEQMNATPTQWLSSIGGTSIQDAELANAYAHPDLYSAYPHLKDAELYANPTISSKARYETGPTGEDMISVKIDRPGQQSVLKDYFARLTDPSSPDYWKTQAIDEDWPSYKVGKKEMIKHVKETKKGLAELNEGLIYPSAYEASVSSPVLHEIQHAVQNFEGFAPGGSEEQFLGKINPETNLPFTQKEAEAEYMKMGGEVEARLTQKRKKYPEGLRRLIFPLDELDRPIEQIYDPRNHPLLKR